MDDTVLKVALAGLLHDIGKLAEDGMCVSPEFINNNIGLYLPEFNGQYTHRHAVFTAAFIDHIEKFLPKEFNRAGWGLDDPFINLAAGHHKPQTPLQWVIAIADRISSGWDRSNFDTEYNKAIAWQDYRKTRLLPLFEFLMRQDTTDHRYRYPLQELSPQNIFPVPCEESEPDNDAQARREYENIFLGFADALERLYHKDTNMELWFEHLDSLLLIFTSLIPAARAGKVVPDVSLYDHCRSVSALAAALYLYHRDTHSLTAEAIRDYDKQKFLLISGDFYGIQDFIFSDSGEAGKNRAKILRGRSFAVSLYCELAADMLCRAIGLPPTSLVLNAAGKFTIIAPNTEVILAIVSAVEEKINHWLMAISYGENTLGTSALTASPEDFVSGKFLSLWERLAEKVAARKYRKFSLDTFGGVVKGYLDSFHNDLTQPLCPFCGKRPSSTDAEALKESEEDKSMCSLCRDHIFLGRNLVKEDRIAIMAKDADIHGAANKLLAPIYNEYQVAFPGGKLGELAKSGKLYKLWDIAVDPNGRLSKEATARFLAGYVPVFHKEDLYDDRILATQKSEAKTEGLIEAIEEGTIKTFEHLAAKAMNVVSTGEKTDYRGIQALGILKADVDQLGLLMACGIKEGDFTVSRLATLSRQLHFFFAVYLPYLLKTDERFIDIYTVFAGGDDLFLIGPWNRIVELAVHLCDRFSAYTCENGELHFSAGISLQKPNTPLAKLARDAEDALEKAKDAGRNRITLFGETALWTEFLALQKIKDRLKEWFEEGLVNSAMMFRLNTLIELAGTEKAVIEEKGVPLADMECLKWRAYFKYTTERNIGRKIKDETARRKAKDEFGVTAKWLEDYGSRLRIALWDVIYNNR